METSVEIILLLVGFGIIAVASNQLARLFTKLHLPFISGVLVIGMLAGPYVLGMISTNAIHKLHFLEEIALAFIAYAAGSELHLEELRSRIRSIVHMSFWQVFITFIMGSASVYFLSAHIPFMMDMGTHTRLAVALLFGTIFVARSPASAIAVIREMRGRGPFTKTALGVTVLTDFVVIVLFTITISLATVLTSGSSFDLAALFRMITELCISFLFGFVLGKLLSWLLLITRLQWMRASIVLASGLSVYLFSNNFGDITYRLFHYTLHPEPLLICIIGSFMVANYSKAKVDFIKIIHESGTPVYVVFFTLTGASMEIDALGELWQLALLLFGIRTLALAVSGVIGGISVSDPWKFKLTAWMPYVTQAGVSLGLAALVAESFPSWGVKFETLLIAVIVLSQFIGPPLFKWALHYVGESHRKAAHDEEGGRSVMIFGLFGSSIALARQLQRHGWNSTVVTKSGPAGEGLAEGIQILEIEDITLDSMLAIGADKADTIVCMYSEDMENYHICEIAFERLGTREVVSMLNNRDNLGLFDELGVLIVDPSSAMISLLDH
ncbi:MAG: cation:proton antiporter, partial [Flavobacteriales bacterium]